MELAVLQYTGKDTGRKVKLTDDILAFKPHDHAIYLDVKNILAKRRQGTHKSKERGEITGSTRKIKKQKGTGTARAGSIKSPLFKGGGRVFGPKPRDYDFKLNKKLKKLARKSAFIYKVQEGRLTVLEDFSFETPKSKAYVAMLRNLDSLGQKTLLILPSTDKNIVLSGRNIQETTVACVDHINTYELLNAHKILISEHALGRLIEILNL